MPVQMVCDSTSLVSAALRDSLPTGGGPTSSGSSNSVNTSGFLEPDEDIDRIESSLSVAIKRNQLRPIRYEEVPGFGQELDNIKSKYTVLKTTSNSSGTTTVNGINGSSSASSLMNGGSMAKPTSTSDSNGIGTTQQNGQQGKDQLPVPKRVLYARENVQIGWKATGRKWQTGAGMTNVGNTCYLNSTLQALFHVPAIANWLISDVTHRERCDDNNNGQGGCIICAMAKTLLASQSSNQGAIKPYLVYSKLRLVCKHLVLGRQEDAHEFLRYLVEAMEKSYLARFKNSKEFDQLTKETTPLNQILGGYLRSEVKCLSCQHISTTFQHFEDLLLDIRKANSIEDALDVYFARERLEENQYKCEACKKRVAATKQFSLERAPFALCIQLKRFSMMGGKINKHVELRNRLDLSPYCKTGKLTYRLVSMVTHLGNTQHCGHYTAIGGTESGTYYVFDDSSVRPISMQNVTSTNAYIIFYELESVQNGIKSTTATATSASYAASASTTGSSSSSKLLGSNSSATAGSTSSSPLRILGPSGQSGLNPLVPSKLENRPGFIGPVLPGQQQTPQEKAKKLANGLSNHHIHFSDADDDFAEPTSRLSPVSSTTSSLSSPSPNKQSRPTTLPSPKKTTNNTLASPASVKNRFGMTITSNGVSSANVASSSNGTSSFKPSTTSTSASSSSSSATTSASTLPSMPKLCNSPAAAKINGESSSSGNAASSALTNGHSKTASAVRLVPYDDADDDEDEEDEDEQQLQRRNGVNGHRVQQHDSDEDEERLHPASGNHQPKSVVAADEEEDSSCSPKSPPVIKSKTGLWKVSDNRPSSSSSSNSTSPATSGNSSPANYQNHNGNNTVTNGRNGAGGPLASGYQTNGGGRQQQYQQQQQQQSYQSNAFTFNGYNNRNNGAGGNSSEVVQQLQKFSHRGYGAPVRSWNGQQTHMDRELALERREDRKRQMEDDRETEMDRGRTKKVKTHFYNNGGNSFQQQRDGNPFQNYQNQNNQMNGGGGGGGGMNNNNHNRKWNNNGYNGGGQRQHKFCDSNRNGGTFYQNGNNYHRNQNGGFRNGGRGRNGFFNKSYNHHQRDNVGASNGYHNNR